MEHPMTEAEQERAAIVEWLRREVPDIDQQAKNYGERGIYHVAASYKRTADERRAIADAIEGGDHLK